jgi:hypothetical protein
MPKNAVGLIVAGVLLVLGIIGVAIRNVAARHTESVVERAWDWLRIRFWQAIAVFRQRPVPATEPAINIGFMPGGGVIASQVDIDLQSDVPMNIQLGSQIPQIFLYFVIVNRSPLDLEFDRMMFNLWVAQPVIYQGLILTRGPIPHGERREGIHYESHLDPSQVAEIRRLTTDKGILEGVRIDLTAYFQTRQGWIEVRKNLQRSKVPVG